jgi:hypothetical protein
MVLASLILILSLAMFLFYLQTTCQRILSRKFDQQALQPIVNANRLEFPYVRTAIEEFDTPVDYPWVRMTLKCDFLALTYLLKNAANAKQQYTNEERLLMLYFRALFLVLSVLHVFRFREKAPILGLTSILQHFAGIVGQRVSDLRFGGLSASDYLLNI